MFCRQPDLKEILNKPSKDATDSSSIRELTTKLKNVEKTLQMGAASGGEEAESDDKLQSSEEEVVLSATNTSGLSATFVTDVVSTGGNAQGEDVKDNSVGKRMSTVLMAKAMAKGVKDKRAAAGKTVEDEAGSNQPKNEVGNCFVAF